MPEWPGFGVDAILAVQASAGAVAFQAMEVFTFLGSEWFYLLVMPALLWCVDAGLGVRMGIALLVSGSLNAALKLAFGLPRPFWVDARVRAISIESSFGLPSGHAQNALVLWGYLADRLRRAWAWPAAIGLVAAISLSRLVLGVHFPADVVVGWAVGAIVLTVILRLQGPLAAWLERRSLRARLAVSGLGPLLLLAVGGLTFAAASARAYPPIWTQNYLAATGGEAAFGATSPDGLIASTGALFGLAIGAALLNHWGRFDGRGGDVWQRIARFVVGVVGVLALYLGLSAVLPEGDTFRFLRYAAVGFWIAYGAPRAFLAARLG